MESSNLIVGMAESVVEFKMRVLEEALRILSPNRILVTTGSFNFKMPFWFCPAGLFFRLYRQDKEVVSRCFKIITTETKWIEAVLKATCVHEGGSNLT